MCYIRKKKKNIKKYALIGVIFAATAAICVIVFINRKLDAIVKDIAKEQIRADISRMLSDKLCEYDFSGDYVDVTYSDGKTSSVKADQEKLNSLKAAAISDVSKMIENMPQFVVEVALSNIASIVVTFETFH